MADLQHVIESRLTRAVDAAFGDDAAGVDPMVRPSGNPKFGDYQANLAMALGKAMGRKPRDVAKAVADQLERDGLFDAIEVAGPGFINLTLTAAALREHAAAMLRDDRLGVAPADPPQTVVVDYSAPNVAKEMHVGHLRSTIIGDSIARVLMLQGHRVIRQNHIGDWGTQFGMLIEHLADRGFNPDGETSATELTRLYKEAKRRFDEDATFAEAARNRVVKLQAGDEATRAVWAALVEQSKAYFAAVYERLGVLLEPADVRGESFYNDRLPDVVGRLDREGHLHRSQGAEVVYPGGFSDRDGGPLPMIVRKSDGGYLYATTDLAAALFRVDELGADRIIYVIGAPQKQHFEMFTTTLRQAEWVGEDVRLDFVGFGSVLGPDRKMFKTRSGETVRLIDLIDEAEQRVDAVIAEKNPDLPPSERRRVAAAVGIGALKYADLSNDRIKDYVFDWDRMLALDGNTAPYLMYSYARIRSIFRKGEVDFDTFDATEVAVVEEAERALVLTLLQFPAVVASVADSLEPHRLGTFLYDLATRYHRFFEHCPVLKADDDATRQQRLTLCKLAAVTLERGLGLLGIRVVERM